MPSNSKSISSRKTMNVRPICTTTPSKLSPSGCRVLNRIVQPSWSDFRKYGARLFDIGKLLEHLSFSQFQRGMSLGPNVYWGSHNAESPLKMRPWGKESPKPPGRGNCAATDP